MFHRSLSGDFSFVVSRRRSGSSDVRVASVALVTDGPALRYTTRPSSPSTSETKNKTDHRQSCLPTSTSPYHIQHFDRHSHCKPSTQSHSIFIVLSCPRHAGHFSSECICEKHGVGPLPFAFHPVFPTWKTLECCG